MLRGYRGIILAVGLITAIAVVIGVLTWPVVPSLKRYSYQRPDTEDYRPGGRDCEPNTLATIRDRRQRLSQADACAEKAQSYRHDRNDLVQQTRAADAAKAQAQVASQGLWTAWFQTIGGFMTLAAAMAAAIYARETARIGNSTYNAFISLERPRLVLHMGEVKKHPDGHVFFEISATNIGKSACVITNGLWKRRKTSKANEVNGYLANPLHLLVDVGKTEIIDRINFGPVEFGESAFFGGVIVYQSAIAEKHRSYFCYELIKLSDHSSKVARRDAKGGDWPHDD